uniref:Hpc2-related domain-containing protein n=2 Tax=Rhodosorus marinus TaxID=101924 RepID=A0A7S2ZQF1_9RHOD|mmetsp:Transcript_28309/g.111160  ORF Transcript_28309/g.111160 Transcript_28309/m.111160 type:complete len:934 (+) Transcript_28309:331-3132(+)
MESGAVLRLSPDGENEINFRQVLGRLKTSELDPQASDGKGLNEDGAKNQLDEDKTLLQSAEKSRESERKNSSQVKRTLVDEYDYDDMFIDDDDLLYEFQRNVPATKYTGFYINRGELKTSKSVPKVPSKTPLKPTTAEYTKKDRSSDAANTERKVLPDEVAASVQALKEKVETLFASRKPNLNDPEVQGALRKLFKAARANELAKLEGRKPGSEKRLVLDNALWKELSTLLRCLRLNLESLGFTLHWTDKKEISAENIESAMQRLSDAVADLKQQEPVEPDAKPEERGENTSSKTPDTRMELVLDKQMDTLIHDVLSARIDHLYNRNQLAQRPKKASKEMPTWLAELRKNCFGDFKVNEKALGEAWRRVEAVVCAERQRKKELEKEDRKRKREEELVKHKEKMKQRLLAAQEKARLAAEKPKKSASKKGKSEEETKVANGTTATISAAQGTAAKEKGNSHQISTAVPFESENPARKVCEVAKTKKPKDKGAKAGHPSTIGKKAKFKGISSLQGHGLQKTSIVKSKSEMIAKVGVGKAKTDKRQTGAGVSKNKLQRSLVSPKVAAKEKTPEKTGQPLPRTIPLAENPGASVLGSHGTVTYSGERTGEPASFPLAQGSTPKRVAQGPEEVSVQPKKPHKADVKPGSTTSQKKVKKAGKRTTQPGAETSKKSNKQARERIERPSTETNASVGRAPKKVNKVAQRSAKTKLPLEKIKDGGERIGAQKAVVNRTGSNSKSLGDVNLSVLASKGGFVQQKLKFASTASKTSDAGDSTTAPGRSDSSDKKGQVGSPPNDGASVHVTGGVDVTNEGQPKKQKQPQTKKLSTAPGTKSQIKKKPAPSGKERALGKKVVKKTAAERSSSKKNPPKAQKQEITNDEDPPPTTSSTPAENRNSMMSERAEFVESAAGTLQDQYPTSASSVRGSGASQSQGSSKTD